MAMKNFKNSVGRVVFLVGTTEDGKIIKKSKTYRNVKENVDVNNLYESLKALAELSTYEPLEVDLIETSAITE